MVSTIDTIDFILKTFFLEESLTTTFTDVDFWMGTIHFYKIKRSATCPSIL